MFHLFASSSDYIISRVIIIITCLSVWQGRLNKGCNFPAHNPEFIPLLYFYTPGSAFSITLSVSFSKVSFLYTETRGPPVSANTRWHMRVFRVRSSDLNLMLVKVENTGWKYRDKCRSKRHNRGITNCFVKSFLLANFTHYNALPINSGLYYTTFSKKTVYFIRINLTKLGAQSEYGVFSEVGLVNSCVVCEVRETR